LIAGDSYAWDVRALGGTRSGRFSAYSYFRAPASVGARLAPPWPSLQATPILRGRSSPRSCQRFPGGASPVQISPGIRSTFIT
jgi:hypothetical protein